MPHRTPTAMCVDIGKHSCFPVSTYVDRIRIPWLNPFFHYSSVQMLPHAYAVNIPPTQFHGSSRERAPTLRMKLRTRWLREIFVNTLTELNFFLLHTLITLEQKYHADKIINRLLAPTASFKKNSIFERTTKCRTADISKFRNFQY